MNRSMAEEVLKALASMESPIGFLCGHLSQESQEDWEKISRSLSSIFKGHFEISLFISNRFPDLDPDGAGKDNYELLKSKYDEQLFKNWE